MIAAAARVGLVVPSGNPVVEPELHRLLDPELFPYTARFPVHADGDLASRLDRYVDDLPAVIATLRPLGPAAAFVACTGSSYPLGVDGDRSWAAAAAEVVGAPVGTAAGAVAEVLARLGADRIRIVSPYPAWLTDQCERYWRSSGLRVMGVHQVDGSGDVGHSVYDTPGSAVATAIERAIDASSPLDGRDDAVVIAGTGVATLDVLDRLAAESDVTVVSSNLAGAWWLLATASPGSVTSSAAGPALTRLLERASR